MRALGWSIIVGVFLAMYIFIAVIDGIRLATMVLVGSAAMTGLLVWASFLIAGGN